MTNVISFSIHLIYCKVFSNVLYGSRYILSAVFDFIKTIDGSTARRCIAIVTNERRASYVIPLNSS